MKKNIFTNCYGIMKQQPGFFLYIFIGGRGVGKTYSMLKGAYFDNKKVMYLRRTSEELKTSCSEVTNPYKAINNDLGVDVRVVKNKTVTQLIDYTDAGNPREMGVACALSTFGNMRGADFSDIDIIIFDEFINTAPVNHLTNEGFLLWNLIETVNRNRTLRGEEEIKVILLSNSNSLDNGIITDLDLAEEIRLLKVENLKKYTDEDRGIYLELLDNKEVKEAKALTSLYKLTKGTAFYEMALDNEFTNDCFSDVKKIDFKEFRPLCCYDDVYFYRHKFNNFIYCSKRKANCDKFNEENKKQFFRGWGFVINAIYVNQGLFYQDYNVKLKVKKILRQGF